MKRLILAIALLASINLYAQSKEVLTNKNIIELSQAGLGKEVILSKISSSNCKFDVSTTGLVALKKAQIPDEVINAMIEKSENAGAVSTTTPVKKGTATGSGNLNLINHLYVYKSSKPVPLEKAVAGLRTKMKAFGYGGTSVVYEIEGETSTIKLAQGETSGFAINTGNSSTPELTLYKLKVEKKRRQAIAASAGTFTGMKTGQGVIPTNIKKLKEGIFSITPDSNLEPGEYFFAAKPVAGANSFDVYTFTVE